MKHFYKHSMHRLMAPLMAQTATEQVSKGIKKGGMLRDSVGYIVHPVNTYIYMYGRELDLVIPSLQI